MPPSLDIGLSGKLITSWFFGISTFSKFSPTVIPVTVKQSGFIRLFSNRKIILPNQIHSNICVNADSISAIVDADASYSNKIGTVCGVLSADCLPVFISNKEGTSVGIAHAGWRGIVDGVIESLIKSFDCNEENLIVHLGPAISKSSYEVGLEIKSQFISKDKSFESCFSFENDKYYLDLYRAAKMVLKSYGINSISGGDRCTFKEAGEYFSYRRDGEFSGRMAHLIWMEHS